LLDVVEKIKVTDWTLDCYGSKIFDNKYYLDIALRVSESKLKNKVFFHDSVGRKVINDAMINSDLLLFFSDSETHGMVIDEAIQSRLPSLITKVGSYRVFDESSNIKVIKDNDTDSIVKILSQLMTNKESYTRLKKANPKHRRSWEQVGDEFLNFLLKYNANITCNHN